MTFTIFNVFFNLKNIVITGKDDNGDYFVVAISSIDKNEYNHLSFYNSEQHIVVRYGDFYYSIEILKDREDFFNTLDASLSNFYEVHTTNNMDKKEVYTESHNFNYPIYGIHSMVWVVVTGMVLARL